MTTQTSKIYLDHAAATPLDAHVLEAMMPFFVLEFYNPSATYTAALGVGQALEAARATTAHWLGARPAEIIFTAGGSEANNLAIHGIMRRYPKANIVVAAIEHDSVLVPARNYECREVMVGKDGILDLIDLTQKIDDNTVLVSIMYANNEIGTIQPLRQVAEVMKTARLKRPAGSLPLYFHSDACQAGNYLDVHVARLGVDMLTLNGGKMYGPKQSGSLFVKAGIRLNPLIEGGGQEFGMRAGTENPAGAVGFSAAFELAQQSRHEEVKRLQELQELFFDLISQRLPNAIINGSRKHRLPNNVHVTFPGHDNERLLIELDQRGIMAAAGSACSAANEEPSHVLRALGLADSLARASVRFSLGRLTAKADIETTVETLRALLSA